MELVEDALHILRRNAASLVDNLKLDGILFAPALHADRGLRRRIFRGVVEEIEQHLLKQHGIELKHGQVGIELHLDPVLH